MSRGFASAVLISAGLLAGCAPSEPNKYRVSGDAKLDGQPIPYGDVLFTPDGAKRNSGPQGIAQIRSGRYDTAAPQGKGIAGGPTVVRVIGLTGPGGKLLCEYETHLDLPRADSIHHIDVPKTTAVKSRKTPDI
jgi:hypothetical protein